MTSKNTPLWLTLYSIEGVVKQVVSIDSISHFNVEHIESHDDILKIYIYFKDDPSGVNYKAVGYVSTDHELIKRHIGEGHE